MASLSGDLTSIVRVIGDRAVLEKQAADPVNAHFFGIIQASPTSVSDLILSMSSIADRDMVLSKIQYFVAIGLIEIVPQAVRKTIAPSQDRTAEPAFRDYGKYAFKEEELSEPNDLSVGMKQEILFLCYYGPKLDHYQTLGIPRDASAETIRKAHVALTGLLDAKRFQGKSLGSYGPKLELARRIVAQTEMLRDPKKRERYDALLSVSSSKNSETMQASDHAAKALALSQSEDPDDIKLALDEINAAIVLSPQDVDLKNIRQKLEKIHKKNRLEKQLFRLDQADVELFEGERLKKEVAFALDLGDHTADIYLQVADIMKRKGLLLMAKKLARQSVEKDPSFEQRAHALIAKVDQILKYYKDMGKDNIREVL
ncbi:MAG TPA: hypothetical protein P5077_11355 [bacterium]|nr:hypothetical protein [bacterium]